MVKEKDKKSVMEKITISIIIVIILGFVFSIGMMTGRNIVDIKLTQEVADDVCRQLTGEPIAIASVDNPTYFNGAKLICTIPSFDATYNIIVKSNDK